MELSKWDTVVVGDIHGDLNLVKRVLSLSCEIIFVGDFLDSFQYLPEAQIEALRLVLDTMENEGTGRVKAILGNHELSYLDDTQRCSGFNNYTAMLVHPLLPRVSQSFDDYLWYRGFLISHAGVSEKLLKFYNITLPEYLSSSCFNQVGSSRGGFLPSGGLRWCDWWQEFEPLPGTKQIVGHSSFRPSNSSEGIVTKGEGPSESFNIDCLMRVPEVLVIQGHGRAVIRNLEDLVYV